MAMFSLSLIADVQLLRNIQAEKMYTVLLHFLAHAPLTECVPILEYRHTKVTYNMYRRTCNF